MAKKQPDMTPGFYQGHQRGLKTGRVSPRQAIRPSRADTVNAAHGIGHIAHVDPHQGQLFNSRQMPALPHADIVRAAGGPAADPLANHQGFMPALPSHKQKINAISRLDAARVRTGVARGGPPVKEAMEDRASVLAQSSARDWYAARDTRGHIAAGEAGEMIQHVAQRQEVSHARAIRAVAVTSPRTAWDDLNAGPTGHSGGMSRPNINSAENVIADVKSLGPDPGTVRAAEHAGGSFGKALGGMKAKAGAEFAKGEPHRPIPVYDPASSKVPNFEQSLHLDNPSRAVQAQAARSYTVDVHDTRSFGGDEAMLKTAPGYHIAAMTGRRAALKAGELPPRGQSMAWETIRSQQSPESMGEHRLFVSDRKGRIKPNPTALPGAVRHQMAGDDRSDTAKRLGLDF